MLFPFLLSRALLPKLRKAPGPAKLVFIGAFAGDVDLPYLASYCASKAFVKRLSGCLGQDERLWSPTNVSTMYMNVGSIVSGSHKAEPSLSSPSSASFAKAVVDKIGHEDRAVVPWLPHAVQFWSVTSMPSAVMDRMLAQAMQRSLEAAKKL